jgi:hypothetical protein
VTIARIIYCVGGVGSPVMCNVYLHRLDRAWDDGDGVLARFADGGQVPVALLGLGPAGPLAGLVVQRGFPGPGGQVPAGAEAGHVGTRAARIGPLLVTR